MRVATRRLQLHSAEQAQFELPLVAANVHSAEQAQCELPIVASNVQSAGQDQFELPLVAANVIPLSKPSGIRNNGSALEMKI